MNGADYFFSGRVDGLEGLAVDTVDKLIVDEPEWLVLYGSILREVKDHLQTGRLSVLATSWRREFN